jgi:hypothetical protein
LAEQEDIQDGLTIDEVLPFFQKFKLKLRVYDVFYNHIFKYDPDTANFNNPALFCVTDGDHIYTLNTHLKSLAHKTTADDYQLTVCPNFYTPEKQAEKANLCTLTRSWASCERAPMMRRRWCT